MSSVVSPENSKDILAVGYVKGVLVVQFRDGSRHRHTGVPKTVYQELITAASRETYYNMLILHKYRMKKLTGLTSDKREYALFYDAKPELYPGLPIGRRERNIASFDTCLKS